MLPEFQKFPKIPRFFRDCIITEKIDGTNGQIVITEDRKMFVGSRKRWLSLSTDNYGFCEWATIHEEELKEGLGPGRHFGEWWGHKIQRGYGLAHRRWSLFNVQRWCKYREKPEKIQTGDPTIEKYQDVLPKCCDLVPILYRGPMETNLINSVKFTLEKNGSSAVPGYMNPEGVLICHVPSGHLYKSTFGKDGHKGAIDGVY
jgi:hypothetical protein